MPATYILTRVDTRAGLPLRVRSVVDVDDRVATFLCFALLVLPLLDLEVEVGDEHNGDDREAEPEHRVLGREVERVDDHQRRTDSDNHPQKVPAFHAPRPVSERETDQEGECPGHFW